MAKIPKDLSMRLQPADRKNLGLIVSHFRKHGDKGRSATVSDSLRWAWKELAERLAADKIIFAPVETESEVTA